MTVYEYKHKRNAPGEAETVHLSRQDEDGNRTLCGRSTTGVFLGDETVSGHAATCGSCLRVFASDAEGVRTGGGY